MDKADLALVLALDGSASVTFEEFGLMCGGMAAAFRDPRVARGLLHGPAGASVAALLLWSGPGAFALPCPDYPAFAAAMRRKLVAEVENTPIA